MSILKQKFQAMLAECIVKQRQRVCTDAYAVQCANCSSSGSSEYETRTAVTNEFTNECARRASRAARRSASSRTACRQSCRPKCTWRTRGVALPAPARSSRSYSRRAPSNPESCSEMPCQSPNLHKHKQVETESSRGQNGHSDSIMK